MIDSTSFRPTARSTRVVTVRWYVIIELSSSLVSPSVSTPYAMAAPASTQASTESCCATPPPSPSGTSAAWRASTPLPARRLRACAVRRQRHRPPDPPHPTQGLPALHHHHPRDHLRGGHHLLHLPRPRPAQRPPALPRHPPTNHGHARAALVRRLRHPPCQHPRLHRQCSGAAHPAQPSIRADAVRGGRLRRVDLPEVGGGVRVGVGGGGGAGHRGDEGQGGPVVTPSRRVAALAVGVARHDDGVSQRIASPLDRLNRLHTGRVGPGRADSIFPLKLTCPRHEIQPSPEVA